MEKVIFLLLVMVLLTGCTEENLIEFSNNITDTATEMSNTTMVWADQQNNRLDCAFAGIPIQECDEVIK